MICAFLICVAAALTAAGGERPATIPDVTVTDQDGKRVSFRELVKEDVVVMNFIFTSCTTICSPMGANFAALQRKLGKRDDVALISVSIDPETDTPARLKKWSARFHARPGWTLVTGSRSDIDRLLQSLGVYTSDRFAHAPVALIGSGTTGRWERVNGLIPADKFETIIDGLRSGAPKREVSTK